MRKARSTNVQMEGASQRLSLFWFLEICVVASLLVGQADGQLSTNFYANSCPSVFTTVRSGLVRALGTNIRAGSSILRLFFHDCFTMGCDGSVLLDDTATLRGEKNAGPNANSLEGFQIVDSIKASVERTCPRTVSCADILAIIARDAVAIAGGPSWNVELGRRDSTTASLSQANNLPNPSMSASQLISVFSAKGLNVNDLVALSGAHTFGKAKCDKFTNRLYNFQNTGAPDPSMDTNFLATLRRVCPTPSRTEVDLDQGTPGSFDNQYYKNLLIRRGLLGSDQILASSRQTSGLVNTFSSGNAFSNQFAASMIKMGRIGVLTGSQGQIRTRCSVVN